MRQVSPGRALQVERPLRHILKVVETSPFASLAASIGGIKFHKQEEDRCEACS
jgi:hypothetical protein